MLPAAPFPRTQGHRRKQADNRGEQRSLLVDPASSLTCQFVTFTRSFAVALKNRRPRERRQPWCPRRHDEVMPSTPPRGSIHRVCGFPHERVVARVACCGCKRPIFDRPADAACRAGLVAWGASCSTTATPTEMRHDIVLRNKACGDTRACADHGGDRLVCAKPAAILHPALRRVGGARGALLLNSPRPPNLGLDCKSPVTPGSLVCDPDEQKSGRCVMWLTEGFQPPA